MILGGVRVPKISLADRPLLSVIRLRDLDGLWVRHWSIT